ncbi:MULTISPECIES: Tat pathway signal protein [unclassified Streptomyces]|uniref:Tat pathway signal protein n=1 Tax=unclassified Streptomyces TaxID=2593676 RepID=UPI001F355260|nr:MULTISPECIES: Tat pathway signal protein [unclassified Streptomyces]MCU4745606.1 Tat pathway signal protein [Streptomyces sp. G-5]
MSKPDGSSAAGNTALRELLKSEKVSYETLAGLVRTVAAETGNALRTNRSAVAHWVAGSQPEEATSGYIAEALSRRLGRPISPSDIGLAPAIVRQETAWPEDTLAALTELGRLDLDMKRRRALTTAAYSAAALAVPDSGWWAQRADRAANQPTASRRRVGHRDLEAVRDMVRLFSRIDQRHGGGHARSAVVQYLTSDVTAYLSGSFADERVRSGMLSAASELAYVSGWMAFDNAEHSVAQKYFTVAVSLAAEAQDPPMAGHVLRAMAHQAVDLGQPRQALQLAVASMDGSRYASASPRERALLGVVHARALAAGGQKRAAASALIQAEDDLSAAGPNDDEPGRVFFFGEASLAHETACTLRDSGDLNGAHREFNRSVRTRTASAFTRTHAVTLGYLGSVQARQGAIEEACSTWSRALDAMDGIRSARARRTALDMRLALSPVRARGIPVVSELDRRASTYLIESA